ncbi:hypothetical protein F0562_020136 [Nyssa sinensis]|uniref:ferric-chelate reductase (NADH) n=1 Tax=Nyssa sinensis TaxID=561372 RepID=A0A5J5BUU3_9ASTE|nr:hypothetical protein F0562_020136 [Nyssa sinensis]
MWDIEIGPFKTWKSAIQCPQSYFPSNSRIILAAVASIQCFIKSSGWTLKRNYPRSLSYNITASVEGPYGHESPYHLMYEDLILVAGGIGISPFLAILRDILHRIEDRKPCPPRNILVVWAVKRSHELSLLYTVDTNSICPSLSDALNLDIQTYVTRELEPPVEEGIVHKSVDSSVFPVSNRSGMSALVGTGNIKWAGIYVVVSTIGLVISLGLQQERTRENEEKKISIVQHREPGVHEDSCQENISSTKFYGCRPDFKEIFGSISDRWGHC